MASADTLDGATQSERTVPVASARALSLTLFGVSLGLALAAFGANLYLAIRIQAGSDLSVSHLFAGLTSPVATTLFALVGLLVSARRPHNPIGWLLGGLSILFGLTIVTSAYVPLGAALGRPLPGTPFFTWLALWLWIPATVLPFSLLPLYFPDGRLPSPRWRPIALALVVGTALTVIAIALHPEPNVSPSQQTNPFGIEGIAGILDFLSTIAGLLVAVGIIGSIWAAVGRYRRSFGAERTQVRWLLLALLLGFAAMVLGSVWFAFNPNHPLAYDLSVGSVWVAIMLIALGVGVAILRFRRYDIDLILNRTLVYGTLSATIVGVYILLVATFGVLFGSTGSLLLAVLAAAVGAVLLDPLRTRLQRLVNRWIYGARDDPYTVLSSLSQQMRFTLLPHAALPRIVETIGRALKLPYVALALPNGAETEIAAAYGRPVAVPLQFPLIYHGETVGNLLVAPRLPGETFTAGEERLLEDIALQAGAAAHVVRLHTDLQRSRERLVTAREEERRRLRRDLHDGLGPQLASLTLTVAAVRELMGSDPAAADRLLQEMAAHAQGAVADIRRVVYGLRPPALDDLGLVSALREQAARCGRLDLEITFQAPETLPALPAAVEVAAYRIAQEALTNVVNHAHARHCVVRLSLGDALTVDIRDDGMGFTPNGRSGVGLRSMRERCAELGGDFTLASAPGRGTHVRAQLPVAQEHA